ncbi:MAG: 5-demethoxyubiquinol-8 5-hydroxylase UbiM [Sphingomonas sp.]|nr:5-demethoxyubiquinol-8 5-hydroxylase UbiM [Sphingomonas sp.]
MDRDIIIVGGGPAGLSFARALDGTGLKILLLERQHRDVLAEPAYDGREIALTHRSIRTLVELGAWAQMPQEEISLLREARVLNGASPLALTFDTGRNLEQGLGMLASNHLIRRALHDCVAAQENVELRTGVEVASASASASGAKVTLGDGSMISARLLVAADSRFSSTRKHLGIGSEINPVGKAMLVCRVDHERDHGHVATEWFGHGQTFAMLPLNGRQSSAVLTLPLEQAERLAAHSDEQLSSELSARYRFRLGNMRVASTRHVYPLVTTLADRFALPGAALVGDTAVGMHPVTAHGFNLGLSSADRLASMIRSAMRIGEDWSATSVLERYSIAHRRAALPIYRATNMIVRLFNDERPAAWAARHAALRLGRRVPLVRTAVRSMLLHAS